ncbi:DUF6760 family protein [Actinophytocola glycyrrhizae]|uniref:DUF6760 family protein n=1 Tax=Actinophytocola glycyrrhizae TaxID=2044873 RepID=A0ABV9S6D8_9PSEU
MTYTTARLWEEVVYVAYHLHWPLAEIADLDHRTRTEVIGQIGAINNRLSHGM